MASHQQHQELYQEFLEAGEKFNEELLDLAQYFEEVTNYHLKSNIREQSTNATTDADSRKRMEIILKEERNSWRLIRALSKDKIETKDQIMEAARELNQLDNNQNGISEDEFIGNLYMKDDEIRLMQVVVDWLEANEASDLDYEDEKDKVEFYSDEAFAWENTFHAMRAEYNINISNLDITMNPNCATTDLCMAMDPDAPIRTKTSLVHSDKEQEIRLFKNLFRHIRAGKLSEGQDIAERVGYYWLSAMLDGWLPYSNQNLDEEYQALSVIHHPSDIKPVVGNKKRVIWKQTCFNSASMQGLCSGERAILGILGGNLKSVLPICNSWTDQLWARIKCSIDVKIETALLDRNQDQPDFQPEFFNSFQSLNEIFNTIKDLGILSPYKEATIHQTVQRHLITNDIDGLLDQLSEWCQLLDFDEESISPHFLRFFTHVVLYLRSFYDLNKEDTRSTTIIQAYICYLSKQRAIESVAYYATFLPKDSQVDAYAKLLKTISDREQRLYFLEIARESKMDLDVITQSVVDAIISEPRGQNPELDKRKISSLDFLLYLEAKNHIAILAHANRLMRQFALDRKMEALQETYDKLPKDLISNAVEQWRVQKNQDDISLGLRNRIRELESFRLLLEVQARLTDWSQCHHKQPEEPKKPAVFAKFCDNVNFEKSIKQFQAEKIHWEQERAKLTDLFIQSLQKMFGHPGGWMLDLKQADYNDDNEQLISCDQQQAADGDHSNSQAQVINERLDEMDNLRKIYIPHHVSVQFNVLQLTRRYEDCLALSQLLIDEDLKLYQEFSKSQVRDFLAKISEVAKSLIKETLVNGS